jgi:serine/threonine-protein kinase
LLTQTSHIDLPIEEYLAQVGTVFRAFRDQDSGCVSYGVEAEGKHWFVKHADNPRGMGSLRRARHLHTTVAHPALPHLHDAIETPTGLALVYDWLPGELLYDYTRFSAEQRRHNPQCPHMRFRALPCDEILAALNTIYEVHLLLADLGFIAVDFYDGCMIYDFESSRMYLCDLDEYRQGPFILEEERLPGSRRFMAPEEFARGAVIDQVTNVFTLGRTALELLGDGSGSPATWRGTDRMLAVAMRASSKERAARHGSVREFVREWQVAVSQADNASHESTSVDNALLEAWKEEEQHPFAGWDFSYLDGRCIEENPPWSYEEMACQLMRGATSVLDLGTGGGERLLAMRDAWPACVVATEGYPPNVALARERLGPLGVEVMESVGRLLEKLPFADAEFDLVIDRHTGFNIREVERVLQPGGIFLTEQVDGKSGSDLMAAFDSAPVWPYFNLDLVLAQLRSTHLVVELAQEWTGKMIFRDVGALIYLLRAVPWNVPGFSVERHLLYLQRLQGRLERGEELAFQQKLLILKARKGPA